MFLLLMLLADLLGFFQFNANLMSFLFFSNFNLWLNVSLTLKSNKSKLTGVGNFVLYTHSFTNMALFIAFHVLIHINNKDVLSVNIDTSLILPLSFLLKVTFPKPFGMKLAKLLVTSSIGSPHQSYKICLLSKSFLIVAPIITFFGFSAVLVFLISVHIIHTNLTLGPKNVYS